MLAVICMNSGLEIAYLGTSLVHMPKKLFLSARGVFRGGHWAMAPPLWVARIVELACMQN